MVDRMILSKVRFTFIVFALSVVPQLFAASSADIAITVSILVPNPDVIYTYPSANSSLIAVSTNILIRFDKTMNISSSNAFSIKPVIAGNFIWRSNTLKNDTLVFTPSSQLSFNTVYTCVVATNAHDSGGNRLSAETNFWFRTMLENIPPSIIFTYPANGFVNIPATTNMIIKFSEAMNTIINPLIIRPSVPGNVNWTSSNTVIFSPLSALPNITVFTLTVRTNARDLAGNKMANASNVIFTTSADVTPPGPVNNLSIVSQDAMNQLAWNNPADLDFSGVLILSKSLSYPSSPPISGVSYSTGAMLGDGKIIYNNSGVSFNHLNLTNFKSYYYKAYARDAYNNYSIARSNHGTPFDLTPPSPIQNLLLTSYTTSIVLTWLAPSTVDYQGTMLRRSTTGFPLNPTDGTLVANCAGSAGSWNAYTNTGLTASTTYYYTLFAYDEIPNYSSGVSALATAGDVTAPDPVNNFQAEPIQIGILLSWGNPTNLDFRGVMIRYRTDGVFPVSKTDGSLLLSRTGSAGSADSVLHEGLSPGKRYYYSIFAYDNSASSNFSVPQTREQEYSKPVENYFSVRPNSLREGENDSVLILVRLPETRNIKLAAYTLAGELVEKIYEGACAECQYTWPDPNRKSLSLVTGVYFIRLQGEKSLNEVRIVYVLRKK